MSGSWWAKKLGGDQPSAPPASRPSPYANVLPQGMGQNQDQMMQRYMDRNGIHMTPDPEPAFLQVGPSEVAVPPPEEMMTLDGDPHNYHRRMWGWRGDAKRGGARETAITGNCPDCDSPRFFSRSGNSVINTNTGLSASPRPECFECGYPHAQGSLPVTAAGIPVKRLPGSSTARQPVAAELIAPGDSLATLNKAGFRQTK